MNNVNFLSQQSYPFSSETGDFLQNMIILVARLSALGGTSYILSNCTKTGNNYAPGLMVINGEILPFDGGVAVSQSISGQPTKDWAVIVENNDNVQVYDVLYPNAFTRRKVVCGMGTGQFDLKTLAQVSTIQALSSAIATINSSLATMNNTIAGKAPSVHNHSIAQVTGLTDALSLKMASNAQIPATQITGLPKSFIYVDKVQYKSALSPSAQAGDLPGDNDWMVINFPDGKAMTSDNYMVVGNWISAGLYNEDNKFTWVTKDHATDSFKLVTHEINSPVQHLFFAYGIVMLD